MPHQAGDLIIKRYIGISNIAKSDTRPSQLTMVKSHENKSRNYFRVTAPPVVEMYK